MADPTLGPGLDLAYISGEVPGTVTDPAHTALAIPGPVAMTQPASKTNLYILGGVLVLGLALLLTGSER